jgi:hypothetical protein
MLGNSKSPKVQVLYVLGLLVGMTASGFSQHSRASAATLTLDLPTDTFVTSVESGSATISPTVRASAFSLQRPVDVVIAISEPSNPSHVDLKVGTVAKVCKFSVKSSQKSPVCSFPVSSARTNTYTGKVVYVVSISSSNPDLVISESPRTVTVSFQP